MRVAFNARPLMTREIRGWGRYTQNLVAALADQGLEIHLLSDHPLNPELLGDAPARFRLEVVSAPNEFAWEQITLPFLCRRARADVLHCPVNYGLPLWGSFCKVLTLHDAIDKSFYDRIRTWRERSQPKQLAVRARHYLALAATDAVITVSEFAKRDIVESFGVDPEKISVIHEAADPDFDERRVLGLDELRIRHPELPERYFFYVGGLEQRKNIPLLLDAMERLPGSPYRLVIAGGDRALVEAYRQRVRERGLADRVRLLGWVASSTLPSLYHHSRCFVYPSFQEGFGLQVTEAMRMGTPVLCADGSSLPEVYGDPESTFSPYDAAALGRLLERMARDDGFHRSKQRHARERSERFSWRKAAAETIAVYERLLSRTSPGPSDGARVREPRARAEPAPAPRYPAARPESDGGSPAGTTARGRKVRAPQGREVANGDPARAEGKCHRNTPPMAGEAAGLVRVRGGGTGKGEIVG